MRLSEDLRKWRSERPDEWTMDRFINEATRLEAEVEKFTSTNSAMMQLLRGIRECRTLIDLDNWQQKHFAEIDSVLEQQHQ